MTDQATELEKTEDALRFLPEAGQLVNVRRRQWIVADVDASTLSKDRKSSSLVTLTSIDEDALGEEISVVWELEPGASVMKRAGLPKVTGSFDDAETLDAFLDAVRWGAATNVDRGYLQSPFRSGVSIEDFQLDPLVRAIDMARTNLLIADDVGLGKTIEAGLVVQEMILRHRARTVLCLVPASLQEKWRAEMEEKFGLEFKIVDTAYVKQLRRERGLHANPWTSFPRLITSIDWAKQGEGLRLFKDALPGRVRHPRKFDLLIIDEAHNVSPSVGRYAVESLRTKLVRAIAPHFQHKLFLTATPHNGYKESFTALLELLDDQRFARNAEPDEAQLARVMVRRLKSDLVDANGEKIYPERRLEALPVEHSEEERRIRRLLDDYVKERVENDSGSGKVGAFVYQLLKKRLSSSPAAFAATIERHVATIEGRRRYEPDKSALDDRILRRAIAKVDEDYDDDAHRDDAEMEAVDEAGRRMRAPTERERKILDELRSWAQSAQHRPDAKAEAILAWLEKHLKKDGEWTEERVIIFTEYRATQSWLQQILVANGYGGDRLNLIFGGMDDDEREAVKSAFQADPKSSPVRILLATDAASEGIDLQNHCHLMIHLEIPYNPNVMEQRNGRIDRHGQKAREVFIWHPVDADGTIGDDILLALRKLDSMRADMGSVNPVIAPQIPDLLEGKRSKLDTTEAEARAARTRKYVRAEKDVNERVAKLHERLTETRSSQRFSPENVESTVRTALKLAEMPDLEPAHLESVPEGKLFTMPGLTGTWRRCLDGLEHPYTRRIRPITFDHEVAKGRDDVVLVHLGHRLVQMSLRLLRAQIWATEDGRTGLNRVSVRSLPDARLSEPVAIVVSRLMIVGGNQHRLHEELTESGGYLTERGFRREAGVTEIRDLLAESSPTKISDDTASALAERFEAVRDQVMGTVNARSKDRLRNLSNTIDTRRRSEIRDMERVLDELERSLQAEIKKDVEPKQLTLFSEDERLQVTRDRAALEARLARIPEEREAEIKAIEERHADAVDHTFPVAVMLLFPKSMTIGDDA
ncbi:DISARM system SNF2-like helicase DrmD [Sphingopyxis sp. XHP0097]|uniref:DISARM system SNF2-like helicase DrmD n=1 Tax=Sphingopyxis jiangsuensis TaxID=2871171 RepID=A0ABS7MI16_9SPHN|nr:DISARM system SNF2-like helicase DrmD [Sphingopyxis jiangsuensis]MBY4638359.1 DISARM system SNF2-like helicase DrmD [Sphingopyxis jiangsuensis]